MGDVKRPWMEKSAGLREKNSYFYQMMLQIINDIFDTSVCFPAEPAAKKTLIIK